LVQALQMRENIWEPSWQRAVDRLDESGRLDDSEIANLKTAYSFLRRCESVLRRHENKSVSAFSSDPDEQRKLAIRLGYDSFKTFRRDYVDARDKIHEVYSRHVG